MAQINPTVPAGGGAGDVYGTALAAALAAIVAQGNASDSGKAPLASPGLTGTPTAPTAAAGTSSTQIATTAFVAAVAGKVGRFYRSTALAVTSGTNIQVPMDSTATNDDTNYYVLASGNIQVKLAGLYQVNYWGLANNPTAATIANLFLNQAGTTVSESGVYTVSGVGVRINGSATLRLAANDVLQLNISLSAGSASMAGSAAPKDLGMSVARLGA